MEHPQTEYTREQLKLVESINKCKNYYYEILNVPKEATDDHIRSRYKKLGLQVHPDKNKAPGAKEAFQVIGKAYDTLIDPMKRERYDKYGPEEEIMLDVQTCLRHASTSIMSFEDIMLSIGIIAVAVGMSAGIGYAAYLLTSKPKTKQETRQNKRQKTK